MKKGWHSISGTDSNVQKHCDSVKHIENATAMGAGNATISDPPRRTHDPDALRSALLRLIIFLLLPFSLASAPDIQLLVPGFPSRTTITALLPFIHYFVSYSIGKLIAKSQRRSVQIDGRSNRTGRRYLESPSTNLSSHQSFLCVCDVGYVQFMHRVAQRRVHPMRTSALAVVFRNGQLHVRRVLVYKEGSGLPFSLANFKFTKNAGNTSSRTISTWFV
jgi:hypothetical protein